MDIVNSDTGDASLSGGLYRSLAHSGPYSGLLARFPPGTRLDARFPGILRLILLPYRCSEHPESTTPADQQFEKRAIGEEIDPILIVSRRRL